MKTIFLAVALTSTLFLGSVGAQQQPILASHQSVSERERGALLQNCGQIQAQIASQFSAMGARKSSGFQNAVKQAITNYLLSVGTPTALQLLKEFQANGFQNFK